MLNNASVPTWLTNGAERGTSVRKEDSSSDMDDTTGEWRMLKLCAVDLHVLILLCRAGLKSNESYLIS